MSHHPETNPHFRRPLQHQREEPGSEPPLSPGVPQPWHQGQESLPPSSRAAQPRKQSRRKETRVPGTAQQPHEGLQHPKPQDQVVVSTPHEQFQSAWVMPPHQQQPQSPPKHDQQHGGGFSSVWVPPPLPKDKGDGPWIQPPQHQDHGLEHQMTQQHNQDQPTQGLASPPGKQKHLQPPTPPKTAAITWLFAVISAIFFIVIFLGGLIVLIIYLVYRPRSPRFDVSSATLNAAYLDAGSLLNADLSVLANFTNPNKKASVDFHYMILDLYYGNTLIATQYIEPFTAAKVESRFANVHMVTSQVRLPLGQSVQLQEQISKNAVIFDIKGVFKVRSNLGSFLRYSYRLYGHCTIMVTAPPSGVLRATRCRTKR